MISPVEPKETSDCLEHPAGRLIVLGSSDVHLNMRGFDYASDKGVPGGGLARLATVIADEKAAAHAAGHAVLTLDNGDSLQGTPLEDSAMSGPGQPHLFYRALARIGYDAAGLGNHDFNFGLDALDASLTGVQLPILCANLHRLDGIRWPVVPSVVLNRSLAGLPLRIGVFSVLPPQTLVWDADSLSGRVTIDDMCDSAQRVVSQLQAQSCDVIVALAHTGLGEAARISGQENALWPLSRLEGLDAIVGGHTHLRLPDPDAPAGSGLARGILNKTPVVMPGLGGAYLGKITLDLSHDGTRWRTTAAHSRLIPASGAEDAAILHLTEPAHRATRQRLAAPVGQTPLPLHSFFDAFAASPALALVAAAQTHALRALDVASPDLPIVSVTAPAKLGGRGGPQFYVDIPAGPVLARHLTDLCFFPNRLAAVEITGAALRDWIEMAAGVYNRITPDKPNQPLLNADWPAHGCDYFYGLSYQLDLSQPPRFTLQGDRATGDHHRVVGLSYQGRPVADDDRFIVALNTYRATGGGNVRALRHARRLDLPDLSIRQAVETYLQAGHFPDDPHASPFTFCGVGDTTVTALSGPGAEKYLSQIGDICTGMTGPDADGFLHLSLKL